MTGRRWMIDFDELVSIGVPIAATVYLLANIHLMWNIPQLRGTLGTLDIVLVLVFTAVNVLLHRLFNRGVNLAFILVILVNLIALAIWYKYDDFWIWTGINLSPLGYHWVSVSRD